MWRVKTILITRDELYSIEFQFIFWLSSFSLGAVARSSFFVVLVDSYWWCVLVIQSYSYDHALFFCEDLNKNILSLICLFDYEGLHQFGIEVSRSLFDTWIRQTIQLWMSFRTRCGVNVMSDVGPIGMSCGALTLEKGFNQGYVLCFAEPLYKNLRGQCLILRANKRYKSDLGFFRWENRRNNVWRAQD